MSIKSELDNGSQGSGNSGVKLSAEREGVNNGITSEAKGMSFLCAYMLVLQFCSSLVRCLSLVLWGGGRRS